MRAHALDRLLLFFVVLVLNTTMGLAQSSPGSQPCRGSSSDKLPVLEARRLSLEREIANKTVTMAAKSKRLDRKEGPDDLHAKELAQSLRKNQEDLLEVLYKIDCAAQVAHAREQRRAVRAAAPKADSVIEVTTYYATNRKQTGNSEPTNFYGAGIESTFRYGRALVTIPPTHVPGNLELPRLWKLERTADPSQHFVLKAVTPLDGDAARTEMAEKLQTMSSKALLVFVHGYNTGFAEAALRTAQLAHDLNFPGMAFFYSWPSANQALRYWQDEETSQLSELVFEQLLAELSQLPGTDIYIVAHSMGNRIVTAALRSRVDKKQETKHIRELLLAAPDINADLFRMVIAPKLAEMQGTRTTLYASSSDLALRASKIVHGFRRVGETLGGVFTYPGFDTIDASGAATMIRAYGHSYLMDSASVLKDIRAIIVQKVAAKQRGLSQAGTSPDIFYRLQ